MNSLIQQVDVPGQLQSPVFAPATITPAGSLVFVGGQNGTDSEGKISENFADQTRQAMRNVLAALDAAGTGPEHVAKLTIYLVSGADIRAGYAASNEVWGNHRTAITVAVVAGLARPDALVEIDAIAALPAA